MTHGRSAVRVGLSTCAKNFVCFWDKPVGYYRVPIVCSRSDSIYPFGVPNGKACEGSVHDCWLGAG